MWFADWRKIKIKSFKKAYIKFTIPILISHISNLFLIKCARKVTISILISHISNLFWKFTISILISQISNLFLIKYARKVISQYSYLTSQIYKTRKAHPFRGWAFLIL